MDWIQYTGFIITISGAVFAVYHFHNQDMEKMDTRWNQAELRHREDMQAHKEDIKTIAYHWENRWSKSEEKWERLFEHLLLKEQYYKTKKEGK